MELFRGDRSITSYRPDRLAEVYGTDTVYVLTLDEYLYMNENVRGMLQVPKTKGSRYLWMRYVFGHELTVNEQWTLYREMLSKDPKALNLTRNLLASLERHSGYRPYKTWLWNWLTGKDISMEEGLSEEQKEILDGTTTYVITKNDKGWIRI